MDDGTVRINELRLRVPGMHAEEGRSFGEDVVRCIAEALPRPMNSRRFGALNLKANVPAGTPRNQIAGVVAKAILRGLM